MNQLVGMKFSQTRSINGLLAEIGDNLSFQQVEIPDYLGGVVGILSNQWEGQIHPGAMTGALRSLCTSKGIHVLTNFEVLEISRGKKIELVGKAHKLLAEKLIICNNAFAKQLLPLATTAVRNQVLLTEEIPDLQMKGCFHYNQGYVYFRNVGHRILIGGARNIDEERETTSTFGETAMIQGFLRSFLEKHILPGQPLIVEHSWSGILGFNESKEPIIKEVGPGMFVAVGLGGMGVAIGSLIGKEVADLLLQS